MYRGGVGIACVLGWACALILVACSGAASPPGALGGIYDPNDAILGGTDMGAGQVSADGTASGGADGMSPAGTGSVNSGESTGTGPAETSSGSGGAIVSAEEALAYFDLDNAERNSVAAGSVCDRVATVQCAGEAHCCDDPGRSFDQCKAQAKSACVDSAFIEEMSKKVDITGFEPERAAVALGEFERLAVACDISVASWGASADGLLSMMQGTLAEGDSCQPSISATLRGPQGAAPYLVACQGSDVVCLPGRSEWLCERRGGVGADCFTDLNCEDGLYCPQNDYLNPRVGSSCKVRLDNGVACRAGNECASLACKDGTCVETSRQSAYCLE